MLFRQKLFPGLRPLNTSLPVAHFATMKSIRPLKPSRAIPIFSRIFPHRLRYQPFRFPILSTQGQQQQQQIRTHFNSTRKFSTRERTGSGPGTAIRASKSLIEDEAEFSDWVSGLSSNSFKKTQLYSDSDDGNNSDSRNRRTSGFSRDAGDSNRGKGREERGGKRRRESGFDDFKVSNRLSGPRDSDDLFPRRKGKFSGQWGGKDDEGTTFRRRNRENGSNVFSREKARESNDRFSGGSRDRQNRSNVFSREKGRDSNERFLRGSRDRQNSGNVFSQKARDSNERFSRGSRDRQNGGNVFSQKARDSNERSSRGGLKDRRENGGHIEKMGGFEMEYGRNSQGKGAGRGRLMLSDEEDEEDEEEDEEEEGSMRFKELIDSEESNEEVDDDAGDEVGDVVEKQSVFSQVGSEGTLRASPSSSPERYDSYLSETRYSFANFFSLLMCIVLLMLIGVLLIMWLFACPNLMLPYGEGKR